MASCVTSKRVILMQEAGKNGIPQYTDTLSYEDYQLRIGDRMYIYVYSVDERINKMFNASGAGVSSHMMRQSTGGTGYDLYTYEVRDDGTIDFPMVGDVLVRGLTTREVKRAIENELSGFVKNYGDYQMISVEVNIVSRRFSVISDRGSGTFSIPKEKITIFEALAMAGDIGDFGDRSQVRIVREKEGVTDIKQRAFAGCETLEYIKIPDSVTTMGSNTFDGCVALKRVYIGKNLTAIPTHAFNDCKSLEAVLLEGTKIEYIGVGAFMNCESLTKVEFSPNVEYIGTHAFMSCYELTSAVLPQALIAMGYGAFSFCTKLAKLSVAKGNKELLEVINKVLTNLIESGKIEEYIVYYSTEVTGD